MKSSLYLQYLKEKQQYPGMSTANIAKMFNVSEAALAHARIGHDAQRLQVDALTLLTKLENIGLFKSTTANRYAIQQMIGRYKNQKYTPRGGIILNPRELDSVCF